MTTTDVILTVIGILQLPVILIGAWILKTLVDLKVLIAVVKSKLDNHESRIHQLEEYKHWGESKIKEMWSQYQRERRDSKQNLPPHS